jgi:biotin-dependent carboxylase-like uncharacterized protein
VIEVVRPGPLTTVQDRGRPGFAHLGVGQSGAADRHAFDLANRLVGNPPDAAALEVTFGGLVVTTHVAVLIALTGASCATTGFDVTQRQAVAVPAGTTLALAPPTTGLRTYVAVRGGVDAPRTLGSRSTDVLGHLGPRPLLAGDLLAVGPDPGTPVPTDFAPPPPVPAGPVTLWPGPRQHWFSTEAIRLLVDTPYTVAPASNRIGVRLSGAALECAVAGDLPSEGIVEGALQVPPDGQPLVFLADHPTTGGYPVLAVVDPLDIGRLAQARPGDSVRFRWSTHKLANVVTHPAATR